MLNTLVHSQDRIYLGKENGEAYSHASLPYPLQANSVASSLHQQQLQLKPVAQSEGQVHIQHWWFNPQRKPEVLTFPTHLH